MALNTDPDSLRAAPVLVRLLDQGARSHGRAVAWLIVISLLAFLPGYFQVPVTDRDEARFAQASRQMVETGDYIDIRLQDEVRYKKPVGIYWLQVAAVRVAALVGVPDDPPRISVYRLPSLAGAVGAVLLTYWTALAFLSRRGALLAGLGLATTILIGVEARLAKTDAVLLMTAVACFGALARAYLRAVRVPDAGMPSPVTKAAQPTGHALPWIVPAVFWTALAASVLVKGPVVPILVALTMLVLVGIDRKAGWLRALKPGPGLLWFALLILPWFIAILSKAGDAFLAESVQKDMLAKVFGAQESHGAPPGYYTLLVWFTFWPSSVVILMALRGLWVSRRQPALRFLLAWVLPGWLFFELVATKLPHYVLPLYPALAILAALTVERRSLVTSGILALARFLWPGLAALLAAGGLVGGLILGTPVVLFAIPLVALAVGCGALAARRLSPSHAHRADPEGAMLLAMAASIAVTATVFGVVLPAQERLFPSRAAAALVRSVSCDAPKLVSAGFSEPSLVFNTTTATKLTGGAGAADFLGGEGCRLALVESRQERPFAERAAALGLTVATLGRVEGINLSNGRTVILTLYRRVNG